MGCFDDCQVSTCLKKCHSKTLFSHTSLSLYLPSCTPSRALRHRRSLHHLSGKGRGWGADRSHDDQPPPNRVASPRPPPLQLHLAQRGQATHPRPHSHSPEPAWVSLPPPQGRLPELPWHRAHSRGKRRVTRRWRAPRPSVVLTVLRESRRGRGGAGAGLRPPRPPRDGRPQLRASGQRPPASPAESSFSSELDLHRPWTFLCPSQQ